MQWPRAAATRRQAPNCTSQHQSEQATAFRYGQDHQAPRPDDHSDVVQANRVANALPCDRASHAIRTDQATTSHATALSRMDVAEANRLARREIRPLEAHRPTTAIDRSTRPRRATCRRSKQHAKYGPSGSPFLYASTPCCHPLREATHDHAGTRTQDLPLKRRLLYQLSYAIRIDQSTKNRLGAATTQEKLGFPRAVQNRPPTHSADSARSPKARESFC